MNDYEPGNEIEKDKLCEENDPCNKVGDICSSNEFFWCTDTPLE